jgi:hypothetical protein
MPHDRGKACNNLRLAASAAPPATWRRAPPAIRKSNTLEKK